MWICTRYGFFSIVCAWTKKGNPSKLKVMIRARKREHLENLLELDPYLGRILEHVGTDYRYRIIARRKAFAHLLQRLLADIDYTNFKDAVHCNLPEDEAYGEFLMSTWAKGFDMGIADRDLVPDYR